MNQSEPVPIVTDLGLPESVRWRAGRIWFCDWLEGTVLSVDRDGANPVEHARVDGFPVCIDWDTAGRLLIVDGANHRVLRLDADGGLSELADLSPLSAAPWNEIIGHPSGRIYVNGAGYDLMAGEARRPGQIAVIESDGSARLTADGLAFPNGMALLDDGSRLVVAESHAGKITRFVVGDDGDFVGRATLTALPGSSPDGLCACPDGSLWFADVPNRSCRRITPYGRFLGVVKLDRGCFSCALSPDGELFVAAAVWDDDTFGTRRGVLYRVDVGGSPEPSAGRAL